MAIKDVLLPLLGDPSPGLIAAIAKCVNVAASLLWLDDLDIKSHPYCFFFRDQPIVRQARRKLAEGCGTAVRPGKIWRHAKPHRHCAAIGRFKCSSHTSTTNCEGPIDG